MRQQGNSPCRILAVDDDENVCRLNVATLTEAGYHVMQPGLAQPPGQR
jgi:DNA-binding NtrC family response regulator